MKIPNILYLHSHDTGRYVQPYGFAVSTPNIQRLAEEGILFRKAFNAAPTCSPSRAALLTGMCPHSCGQLGLVNRGFYLPDCSKHIIHTLRKFGYSSALAGIQHIVANPNEIGYDRILAPGAKAAKDIVPAAIDFLNTAPQQPFFLSVGFVETHRKFPQPDLVEDERYCQPPLPLPDTPETRRDMAEFKTSAKILDKGIGTILKALEDNKLADNTLVICTTDHGIAFPRMKCNLTDHGGGVMLIMRGPGGFSGGKVSDSIVSQIDLFPTICDLLGIDPPGWLEGKSLMPIIRGEQDEVNDAIFAEVNFHCPYEPQRAVRTSRWKYIRRYLARKTPLLANCDPGLSKDLLMANGWGSQNLDQEQLYDLMFDPAETHNLIDRSEMQHILKDMRGRLDNWMKRTDDPLLQGDLIPPNTAAVSRPDDIEPFDIWQYTPQREGLA